MTNTSISDPRLLGGATQLHQAILRAKGIRSGGVAAARNDLAGYGKHGVRLALEEVADGAIPLRDPRTFIQQTGGGQKRLEVDFDATSAERLQAMDRGGKKPRVLGVAEKLQLRRAGNPETEARARKPR